MPDLLLPPCWLRPESVMHTQPPVTQQRAAAPYGEVERATGSLKLSCTTLADRLHYYMHRSLLPILQPRQMLGLEDLAAGSSHCSLRKLCMRNLHRRSHALSYTCRSLLASLQPSWMRRMRRLWLR